MQLLLSPWPVPWAECPHHCHRSLLPSLPTRPHHLLHVALLPFLVPQHLCIRPSNACVTTLLRAGMLLRSCPAPAPWAPMHGAWVGCEGVGERCSLNTCLAGLTMQLPRPRKGIHEKWRAHLGKRGAPVTAVFTVYRENRFTRTRSRCLLTPRRFRFAVGLI